MKNAVLIILMSGIVASLSFASTKYHRVKSALLVTAEVEQLNPKTLQFEKKSVDLAFYPGQIVALQEPSKWIFLKTPQGIQRITLPDHAFTKNFLEEKKDSKVDWLVPEPMTGPSGKPFLPLSQHDTLPHIQENISPSYIQDMKIYPEGSPRLTVESSQLIICGSGTSPNYCLANKVCFETKDNKRKCGWTMANNVKTADGVAAKTASAEWDNSKASRIISDDEQADFLNENPAAPIKDMRTRLTDDCPPDQFDRTKLNNEFIKTRVGQSEEEVTLRDSVGICTTDPKPNYRSFEGKNVYDGVALQKVKKAFPARLAKKIKKSDGKPLSEQDFVDIDVLARTVYGEMETCGGKLSEKEYMDAVAKTIVNRADLAEKMIKEKVATPRFVGGPHSTQRTGLVSRAALSYRQYSVWNDLRWNDKRLLDKVLCPPKPKNNTTARIAWDRAVKTAMDAIINRNEFNARTKQVSDYYYTSDQLEDGQAKIVRIPSGKAHKFVEMKDPSVDGNKLDNNLCMRFWDEVKRAPAAAPKKK